MPILIAMLSVLVLVNWAVIIVLRRHGASTRTRRTADQHDKDELIRLLIRSFAAAKMTLSPCPACDLEPPGAVCLCNECKQRLAITVAAIDELQPNEAP